MHIEVDGSLSVKGHDLSKNEKEIKEQTALRE